MNTYKRKTHDEWKVITNYGYGWEVECVELTRQDAIRTKKEYLENAYQLQGIKIVKKRVRNEANNETI